MKSLLTPAGLVIIFRSARPCPTKGRRAVD
jgi:hypothetical protein